MRHGKWTFLVATALLAAFASSALAQTTMRFQFKEKDKLHYAIEQKTKSTQKIAGAEVKSDVNVTMAMVWEVVKVDSDGAAQVKMRVTHSKMSMDSLLGMIEVDSKDKDIPKDLAGKMIGQMNRAFASMEISATMLKNVKVAEATAKALKAIPGAEQLGDLADPENFKDMLSSIVFPPQPITKGKSWSYKTETQGPEGKTSTEHVFTHEETIQQDGAALEKISLKPTIKVQADPKAMLKVDSLKSSGYVLFDNKLGRFVSSTIQQTKTGKIDIMGIALDNVSEQTTTIRLTGLSAAEKAEAAGKIESLKIDETEFVEKNVAKEELETLQGVGRSFTLKRSYEPAIIMEGSALASADLKSKVDAALEISIGKKVAVSETIALDGKDVTKLNVIWVERYRRATAVASDGSTLTFTVRVGLRIKLEKPK